MGPSSEHIPPLELVRNTAKTYTSRYVLRRKGRCIQSTYKHQQQKRKNTEAHGMEPLGPAGAGNVWDIQHSPCKKCPGHSGQLTAMGRDPQSAAEPWVREQHHTAGVKAALLTQGWCNLRDAIEENKQCFSLPETKEILSLCSISAWWFWKLLVLQKRQRCPAATFVWSLEKMCLPNTAQRTQHQSRNRTAVLKGLRAWGVLTGNGEMAGVR